MWQKMVRFSYCIGFGALKHWNKRDPILFLRPRGTILLSDLHYVSKKQLNKILDLGRTSLRPKESPKTSTPYKVGSKA